MKQRAAQFAFSMRRSSALVFAVLVLAIPVAAVISACGGMSCCVKKATPIEKISRADCCSPVTCMEAPSQEFALATAVSIVAANMTLEPVDSPVVDSFTLPVPTASHAPPPSSAERLSLLSTLLI